MPPGELRRALLPALAAAALLAGCSQGQAEFRDNTPDPNASLPRITARPSAVATTTPGAVSTGSPTPSP